MNVSNKEDFCSLKNEFLFNSPESTINNDLIKPTNNITISIFKFRKIGAFKQVYITFKSNSPLSIGYSAKIGTIQSDELLPTGIVAFGGSNKTLGKITSSGDVYITNVSENEIEPDTSIESSFMYL